jgi:hypothetical protein
LQIQQLNSSMSTTSPSVNKLKPTCVLPLTFESMVPFKLVTNGGDGIFDALLDEFEMVDEEDEDE